MTTLLRAAAAQRIVELIGHTPLLKLNRLVPDNPAVEIFAKAEFLNPGGSVKDRAAASILRDAERQGRLRPGTIILDATSGNTGIAYAMIAAARGYRLMLCLPDNVTVERKRTLQAYGAELILTDPMEGTDGAIREARRRQAAEPDRYFYADQYNNDSNWRAHYETTATEILEQTDGRVTHFVAGLGTSGTLMGVGRYLHRAKPGVRIVAAEPLPGEGVQGLRSLDEGFVPEILDPSMLDAKYLVSNADAIAALRDLVDREGIFGGPSCGAVLVAAAREARRMDHGTIVALLPDGGWKYLSAGTFTRDLDEMRDDLEGGVSWW